MLSTLHSMIDNGASTRELLNLILPHVNRHGADLDILAYGTSRPDEAEEEEDDDDDDASMAIDPGSSDSGSSDSGDGNAPAVNVPRIVKRRSPKTLPAYPFGMFFP
jgi:hypothetical protein